MRILIVEDEPDLLRSLAQALREEGYAVDTAPDGEDGFYKAENYDYDAIVLDVMLPKMDGWEILKRLRKIKKTPVLMLTARDQSRDRVKGLDSGADDYLVKPFDLDELFARLRAIIRRSANKTTNQIEIGKSKLIPRCEMFCSKKNQSKSPRANTRWWNFSRCIAAKSSRARSFTSICSTKTNARFPTCSTFTFRMSAKSSARNSSSRAAATATASNENF